MATCIMCAIRPEFLNNIYMNVGIPFSTQSLGPVVDTVHVLDNIRRPGMYPFTILTFFQASKTTWWVCFAEVMLMVHKKWLHIFIWCAIH